MLVKLTLSSKQATALAPILDQARAENGYEGLLATIARVYSPTADHGLGGTLLELQVVQLLRAKALRVMRVLASESTAEQSSP
jgi:hypothetical protein